MSDPVTNVEIEDVLSSIRRLVSTDDRSDAQPEDAAEDAPDKLVLTPSLRVSDAEDAAEDAAQEADSAEEDHADLPQDDNAQDDQAEAELEATAEADDGTPVQDVWTEDESDEAQNDTTEAADMPDQAAEQEDEPAAAATDAADDQDDNDDHDQPDELTARVAGFEEAVAARDDGWEPDGEDPEDDNAAKPLEEALPWQDADAEDDTSADLVEDAEIVSPTEGLDPFEPEEDDDPVAETPVSDEPAAAGVNAFLAEEDPLGDEAAILDEEALRDLVTEIVRQELQGSLGERITRNVRKLVRREINRALSTQELE